MSREKEKARITRIYNGQRMVCAICILIGLFAWTAGAHVAFWAFTILMGVLGISHASTLEERDLAELDE